MVIKEEVQKLAKINLLESDVDYKDIRDKREKGELVTAIKGMIEKYLAYELDGDSLLHNIERWGIENKFNDSDDTMTGGRIIGRDGEWVDRPKATYDMYGNKK